MATSSVNIVNTLGAGSGVDTKSLAQSLVDAERTPRKDAIDAKIKKEEAKITGHGAIKSLLTQLQTALARINDAKEFTSITANNTQPTAFGATSSASALSGSYSVEVSQIAKATRLATTNFASTDTLINSGSAFDLSLTVGGGSPQTISVTTATPAGVVSAINASTTTTGVSAQLLNTGSGYSIVFSGQTGAANAFTISSLPSDMTMRAQALDTAQDASVTINGLPITSTTNRLSDTIPGLTLDLYAPTTGAARLDLNRQTAGIKDNVKAVVEAYNQFDESLKVLADKESEVEEFGGALAGDSIVNTIRNQVRAMISKDGKVYPDDDTAQPSLNPDIYAARHVGLSFDRTGKLTLDEARLDAALADRFDQVVTLFTANKDDQSIYSVAPGGLAGDAVKSIDKMLRSSGVIDTQTKSANSKIEQYKEDLTQLEERMAALLTRYTKQFAVMESIVGESNSTRTSLTNSFKGLMAMYTNDG